MRFEPVSPPATAGALRAEAVASSPKPAAAGRPRRARSWTGSDRDFSREAGARGWIGMVWPQAYGGHQRGGPERTVVPEEMLAAGAPAGAHWIGDLTKRLPREGRHTRLSTLLEMSAAFQAIAHETADHKEAGAAMPEKRAPQFTGVETSPIVPHTRDTIRRCNDACHPRLDAVGDAGLGPTASVASAHRRAAAPAGTHAAMQCRCAAEQPGGRGAAALHADLPRRPPDRELMHPHGYWPRG